MKFETILERIGRETIRQLAFVAVALAHCGGRMGHRYAVCEWLARSGAEDTQGDRGALVEIDVIAVRPK